MADIKVGKADVRPDISAHTAGIKQGNKGPNASQPGHNADGTSTAARSTGINSEGREPIDPSMPNLSPA
jgi:hypothetical protein